MIFLTRLFNNRGLTHTVIEVTPFQGCGIVSFIFRGLTPSVIKVTPFQGCKEPKVKRT